MTSPSPSVSPSHRARSASSSILHFVALTLCLSLVWPLFDAGFSFRLLPLVAGSGYPAPNTVRALCAGARQLKSQPSSMGDSRYAIVGGSTAEFRFPERRAQGDQRHIGQKHTYSMARAKIQLLRLDGGALLSIAGRTIDDADEQSKGFALALLSETLLPIAPLSARR
eukprot:9467565-Pyramimonas_sp.AAC.1